MQVARLENYNFIANEIERFVNAEALLATVSTWLVLHLVA